MHLFLSNRTIFQNKHLIMSLLCSKHRLPIAFNIKLTPTQSFWSFLWSTAAYHFSFIPCHCILHTLCPSHSGSAVLLPPSLRMGSFGTLTSSALNSCVFQLRCHFFQEALYPNTLTVGWGPLLHPSIHYIAVCSNWHYIYHTKYQAARMAPRKRRMNDTGKKEVMR